MDGTEVAVKILRPGTRPQVILDLWILRTAAERIFDDWCRENIGCTATLLVDEFAEKLLEGARFRPGGEQPARFQAQLRRMIPRCTSRASTAICRPHGFS